METGPEGLEPSQSKGTEQSEQLKINFAGSAKQTEKSKPLYQDQAGGGKQANVQINVDFAMAIGETPNFSQPTYSGVFEFYCDFEKQPKVSHSPSVCASNPLL